MHAGDTDWDDTIPLRQTPKCSRKTSTIMFNASFFITTKNWNYMTSAREIYIKTQPYMISRTRAKCTVMKKISETIKKSHRCR